MATTPEGKVKRLLDKMLKEEGIWSFPPQSGIYGRSGIPDRIAIVLGRFVAIECKADKTKYNVTALQQKALEEIKAAGGKTFIVWDEQTVEMVRDWITACRTRERLTLGNVY
jgi:Holliday junction resolvase